MLLEEGGVLLGEGGVLLGEGGVLLGEGGMLLWAGGVLLGKVALCSGKVALNCEMLHRGQCLGLIGSILRVYSFFAKCYIIFLSSTLSTPPYSLDPSLTHPFDCQNDA